MLIETVEQSLLVVLRDELERGRREEVAHTIFDVVRERHADVDPPT